MLRSYSRRMPKLFWKKKRNPVDNFDSQDPVFAVKIGFDDSNNSGVLKFDREKDVALCVGINIQTNKDYNPPRLETSAKSARETYKAFITTLGLKDTQVKLSIASNNNDCSKNGLQSSFLGSAKQVKEKGNFIFYFSGHACVLQERCILAPADFAKNKETGISGEDLVQWLNDADCKASNVLFIFDCCFAASLGEISTQSKVWRIPANLFVICGCAARETVISVGILGHSFFAYFLLDYLKTCVSGREFKIHQAIDVISDLCLGLCNLLLRYKEGKLQAAYSIPELQYNIQDQYIHITNESKPTKPIISTLESLLKDPLSHQPHKMVKEWLQCSAVKKSLKILYDKASLPNNKNLQNCIVCFLIYSSVLVHYEYCKADKNVTGLEEEDIFLQIAIEVSNEVTFCNLTIDHVMVGLKQYITAVESLGISIDLQKLRDNIASYNTSIIPAV